MKEQDITAYSASEMWPFLLFDWHTQAQARACLFAICSSREVHAVSFAGPCSLDLCEEHAEWVLGEQPVRMRWYREEQDL